MTKVFFTADTHFDHVRVIGYCNRSFSNVNEMNEILIHRWNSLVSDSDIIYVLGDFSLSLRPVREILPRLRGRKRLAIGNHDRPHRQEKYIDLYKEYGFEEVERVYQVEIGGHSVTLYHFPYWNGRDQVNHTKYRLMEDRSRILLCGHSHLPPERRVRTVGGTLQIDVGVDAWDYYPVSEDQILETIKENGR